MDTRGPAPTAEAIDAILPQPFAWCPIPAGSVSLGDFGTATVQPCQVAKYPVTVGQFDVFLRSEDGYADDRWWTDLAVRHEQAADQKHRDSNLPRVHVTWYECVAYCRWLSARLGVLVRMPDDWEWQWAASAGYDEQYPWGGRFLSSRCNTKESGLAAPTPVDHYPDGATPFGICDMSGNVWERTLGVYGDPANVSVAGRHNRTIRGGSWRYSRVEARITHRQVCLADRRFDDGGFRIIQTSGSDEPSRVVTDR